MQLWSATYSQLTVRSINQSLGQGFDSLMLHTKHSKGRSCPSRVGKNQGFDRVLPCAKFLNLRTVDTGHYGFDCDNEKQNRSIMRITGNTSYVTDYTRLVA